jgi:hypothetical protein
VEYTPASKTEGIVPRDTDISLIFQNRDIFHKVIVSHT